MAVLDDRKQLAILMFWEHNKMHDTVDERNPAPVDIIYRVLYMPGG